MPFVAVVPVHVTGVRDHLVDVLGEDFSTFGQLCATVVEPLTVAMPEIQEDGR